MNLKAKTTAADTLETMAATFRERNKVYGDNYLRLGNAMHALFPEGLTVQGPADWTRIYFFMLQQVKASRYATNFKKGGHADSIHDSAVYAALLETYDAHQAVIASLEPGRAPQPSGDSGKMGQGNRTKKTHAPARAQANGGQRPRGGGSRVQQAKG